MQSPFRKLVRISIVLFAIVLLCNFFAYYLVNKKSAENEELVIARVISGQAADPQPGDCKAGAIIAGSVYGYSETRRLKDSLAVSLAVFQRPAGKTQIKVRSIQNPPAWPMFSRSGCLFSYINPYYDRNSDNGQEMLTGRFCDFRYQQAALSASADGK